MEHSLPSVHEPPGNLSGTKRRISKTSVNIGLTSQMFLICLIVLCWLSLMNVLTMAKTVGSEILHDFQACCRGGFHRKSITLNSNLCKPAPTWRSIHRLGRVYKNCLLVATLKGKPAPTNLHRQFNENGARCKLARNRLFRKRCCGCCLDRTAR
jgi:hypothetical protein